MTYKANPSDDEGRVLLNFFSNCVEEMTLGGGDTVEAIFSIGGQTVTFEIKLAKLNGKTSETYEGDSA